MKKSIITFSLAASLLLGGCARFLTYADYTLDVTSGDQTASMTASDARYDRIYSLDDENLGLKIQVLAESIAMQIENKSDETIVVPIAKIRYTDYNGTESNVVLASTPADKYNDTPAPVTVAPHQIQTINLIPLNNVRFTKLDGYEHETILPDFRTTKDLNMYRQDLIGRNIKLNVKFQIGNAEIEKVITMKVKSIDVK